MSAAPFLALTAAEEYWDTSRRIVFLGDWCRLYRRKAHWQQLDHEVLPNVWQTVDQSIAAIAYTGEIYERALAALTDWLNGVHRLSQSTRYYRVLLGNWLMEFVHQAYDKYLSLQAAARAHPGAATWLTAEADSYVALDIYDYYFQITDDRYAHQIYSQILRLLGRTHEARPARGALAPIRPAQAAPRLRTRARKAFFSVLKRASQAGRRSRVLITEPYVLYGEVPSQIALALRSGFALVMDDLQYPEPAVPQADLAARRELDLGLRGDEFERLLSRLVALNLPRLYLEGFAAFRRRYAELPIVRTPLFFTANALYFNNYAKLHLAENPGVRILNMVHGAGYGLDCVNPATLYEKSVAAVTYTGGWSRDAAERPLPVAKYSALRRLVERRHDPASQAILFALPEFPRYVHCLYLHPVGSKLTQQTVQGAVAFLQALGADKRALVRVRAHPDASVFGCDAARRILDQVPGPVADDVAVPFAHRLAASRVYVTNHLGTTLFETLAANRPTVFFYDSTVYRIHADAEALFGQLARASILQPDAASAARFVERTFATIEAWWRSPEVQAARASFAERFCRTDERWIAEWIRELPRA
jgi:putative transferase (TIGR04331 family)